MMRTAICDKNWLLVWWWGAWSYLAIYSTSINLSLYLLQYDSEYSLQSLPAWNNNVHRQPLSDCVRLQAATYRSRTLRGTIHGHYDPSIFVSHGYVWRRPPAWPVVWCSRGETLRLFEWSRPWWTWSVSKHELVGFLSLYAFVYDVSSNNPALIFLFSFDCSRISISVSVFSIAFTEHCSSSNAAQHRSPIYLGYSSLAGFLTLSKLEFSTTRLVNFPNVLGPQW